MPLKKLQWPGFPNHMFLNQVDHTIEIQNCDDASIVNTYCRLPSPFIDSDLICKP